MSVSLLSGIWIDSRKSHFNPRKRKWRISTTCVKQATGFCEEVHRGIIRCIILYPVLRSSCKEHCAVFKNEASPRLTVPAKIVDMRRKTHHHHSNGHHHHTHTYHVTFEVESGDRMELKVSRNEYGMLMVGESGKVSFQGTRYLGFERL